MNMVMTDVTGLHDPKPGDEVVFLGTQGKELITADQIAEWIQEADR